MIPNLPTFSELIKRALTFVGAPSLTALASDDRVYESAQRVVSLFYFVMPLLAFEFINQPRQGVNFEPLWMSAWARWFKLEYIDALSIVGTAFVAIAIIGILTHRYRWGRVLVFLAIWQVHALESAFGSMNHQWYPWLYISFVFIFLPGFDRGVSRDYRRQFLLYFWVGQAISASIYSIAGFHKIMYAYIQSQDGLIHAFHPLGFAYLVSDWVLELQEPAMLSGFIVEHPYVIAPFFMAFIIVQSFSWWIMVRPSLQQIWACVLILFHMGTRFTMGIEFSQWMILVTVLFLPSPFVVSPSLRTLWEDLPSTVFIRALLRRLHSVTSKR